MRFSGISQGHIRLAVLVDTLFFDMNSYFASVAQQEEPALIGRPVGVLTTESPRAACIAASVEAKRYGVKMGVRQHEARKMCPGIVFRVARHDVCVRYHRKIRAAAEKILPIKQAHSVDEFSCDLIGRQRELVNALQIAQALQASILTQVGPAMQCSVGLAPTVLLAKMAAELQKPAGINWLHPSVLPDKIAHRNLEDVPGVGHAMVARLRNAGIHTIPALYKLSAKNARYLWGNVNGERFLREFQGEKVVWPKTAGHSLGHGQVLSGPNTTRTGARLVARRLLVKAAARLRRQGQYAGSLTLSVKYARSGRDTRHTTFSQTQDSLTLLRQLERLWGASRGEHPKSVGVSLGQLVLVTERVADLFAAEGALRGGDRREKLCHLIDGLNYRYGQDTIRFGELPPYKVPYTGAKIAFGRIPDDADFLE